MSGRDGGCKWCDAPAFRKQGRILLCKRHCRFQTMRVQAKRHGKTVPGYDELGRITPVDMTCVGCNRTMVWTQAEDMSRVISLQHDRDGTHRVLCRACNTRHAAMPDDSFYSLPPEHKRCPGCEAVKPFSDFGTDRSRFANLKTYCRECSNERHNRWADRNRDRLNQEQRERRAISG